MKTVTLLLLSLSALLFPSSQQSSKPAEKKWDITTTYDKFRDATNVTLEPMEVDNSGMLKINGDQRVAANPIKMTASFSFKGKVKMGDSKISGLEFNSKLLSKGYELLILVDGEKRFKLGRPKIGPMDGLADCEAGYLIAIPTATVMSAILRARTVEFSSMFSEWALTPENLEALRELDKLAH